MRYLLSLILFLSGSAHGDYPSAKLNQHLCEEISGQNDRLIPRTDWFCASIDGIGFGRLLGREDFYHGVGHWTQARAEFSWAPNVAVNVRSIFYSGSSSNGYAEPTGQYNLFSFRFSWPEKVLGGILSVRAIDLDRQTVGAGLFLQDKESNGGIISWEFDTWEFKLRQESTGWFYFTDDVSNPEFAFFNRKIGFGSFIFLAEKDEFVTDRRKPYHYVFSDFVHNDWEFKAEVGTRNEAFAGLLGVGRSFYLAGFDVSGALQVRHYDNLFAEGIAGLIEHQYISFDQYNKPFTNTHNIFAKDDNLDVYTAQLNLGYTFTHQHRMKFLNEVSELAYRDIDREPRWFYRLEYNYYPFTQREDHFSFYTSNKVLDKDLSYIRPPRDVAFGSVPLFREYSHVGIEGIFRL